jgi:hypothetical protein
MQTGLKRHAKPCVLCHFPSLNCTNIQFQFFLYLFCAQKLQFELALLFLFVVIIRYIVQAEEAKLISQLSEMDAINGELFKQAYKSSVDASEYLDRYQMYKLLKGPYDKEGACIIVTAVSNGVTSEVS